MNLDRFKKIKSPEIDLAPDRSYVDTLNALPREKKKRQILPVLGTVAAALVVVIGVGVWSLIGRGIRNTAQPTPASDTDGVYEELTVSEDQTSWFQSSYYDSFFKGVPIFDSEHKPSVTEITHWFHTSENLRNLYMGQKSEDYSAQAVKEAVEKYFGLTYELDPDRAYVSKNIDHCTDATLDRVLCKKSADGNNEYVYYYTLKGISYELRCISTRELRAPVRFLSHTEVGKPVVKDYTDDKIYQVIEDYVYSDTRITKAHIYIYDVKRISDTLYTCEAYAWINEVTDPARIGKIHDETFQKLCQNQPMYIDYRDGVLSVAEDQPNAYVPIYDKTSANAQFIINHGLVEMPEFESEIIAADDTQPQSADIDFETSGGSCTTSPNSEGYYFREITFDINDKRYIVGFISKQALTEDPQEIKADYFIFKKELGSYTGKESEAYR